MHMIWALLCVSALTLSTIATGLIAFKLYKDWHVRANSVRWLFAAFFTYQFISTAARLIYFTWLTVVTRNSEEGDDEDLVEQAMVETELYRMGTSAVLKMGQKQNAWVTAAIIVGDTTHFGVTVWIASLVYELSKLVALAMDRGEKHESAKIRLYSWLGHSSIAVYFTVQVVLAIVFTGYSSYAYSLLLVVYLLQILVLLYMMTMVVVLKVKGRNYESVHGHFVASPLYRRLKWIMLVYALFAFQFQFSSLILYLVPNETKRIAGYAGVSFVLYYLRGFVLSVVTGCSQPYVVRCLGCCVPDDIKAHYTQRRECVTVPGGWDLPYINPVFVFTDIESSSALWGVGDGKVMQLATQIHDSILRGLLPVYRGYEITTAGDSFQLAFHTIREAAEYCLAAQIQLLNAKWPKDLHGLVPATRRVRVGTKTIFRGLRVRMGIHDAVGADGSLIQDVHAVTGKLTYTGASEVIANEIGDLGAGGQILVTKRVADWLGENSDQLAIKFMMEPVCEYSIPRLNTMLEVFQVVPKPLELRCESFYSPRHIVQIEREDSRLKSESQTFYTLVGGKL
ncbi:hypothetical protein PF005_g3203 [Phytophthora fragariae]|uniref:Guanylate cyclase domain-containing protein n=1 Tax=Phytophthora fragariae TaxID=53985 RepID=A0A6A3TCA7_9STRA|nr:hypothetical protein PF003_g17533 [Phytophthora fragariae]KAE8947777.1 hypothetical protein PF009_g2610 [Phytophthora fragariae]KAE9133593.1 hypothetical protein PF010_g2748 [Phytophthora fragariae]KAE9133965.1 hypothetical protein PF007_g3143 [Phytophthora fragariae]KAE9153254.1 hypothetical protein PF006_g2588 [Phytophthora fragariae]